MILNDLNYFQKYAVRRRRICQQYRSVTEENVSTREMIMSVITFAENYCIICSNCQVISRWSKRSPEATQLANKGNRSCVLYEKYE